MSWQPIDSAQRFQHVLVWNGLEVAHSYWGKVSHVPIYGWLWLYSSPENCELMDPQPTHWMPLPAPPEAE